MEENNVMKSENAVIKVIGVGGAGCNAIKRMIAEGIDGVEYIVVNTDLQVLTSLENSGANVVLIGNKTTRGLGAGANPEVGKKAAEESREDIRKAVAGADLAFITAGMGGGTGTGAAAVVAAIAREEEALTVSICTTPFSFEGRKRKRMAEKGRKELYENSDTLITIPNDKILASLPEEEANRLPVDEAYALADSVLLKNVVAISDLINKQGNINLDYADFSTAVKVGGSALMGTGEAKGEQAAIKAAQKAMTNPLLTHGITGANAIIMNFTGSEELSFMEITRAAAMIEEHADEDAEVLFGHVIVRDPEWEKDRVEVTIVATGFREEFDTEGQNSVPRRSATENFDAKDIRDSNVDLSIQQRETASPAATTGMHSQVSYTNLADVQKELSIEVPTFLRRRQQAN